jgi:predicted XRE-type DNA-binding protein
MRAIEKKRLTLRQLEKVLDVPQLRVSELINEKIRG